MAQGLINSEYLYDIGNALRSKMNVQNTFSPSEMAGAIMNINGNNAVLGTKTIIANGLYNAVDDSLDGYSAVNVQVPVTSYNSGVLNAVANGVYNASDYDFDGFNSVNIAVPIPTYNSDVLNINANGIFNAADYYLDGFNSVTVNVPPQIVITENDSTPPSDTNVLWVYPDDMQDLSEVSY